MIKDIVYISLILGNSAFLVFLFFVFGKWIKKLQDAQKKLAHIQKLIRGLQTADMRFNRKVDELQQETEQMILQSEQQSEQEVSDEKYRYALSLLKLGMPLEEVMASCEIGRAEAELLQSMESYDRFAKAQAKS